MEDLLFKDVDTLLSAWPNTYYSRVQSVDEDYKPVERLLSLR
jgi:hypothetical protein